MKCVIIGGSGHFEYALNSENAELICAYAKGSPDEDISRLKSLMGNHVSYYDSYLDMLIEVMPEVAIVNPHFYLNGEIVLACLKKGIHVFCEKPLAFGLETSAAIFKELETKRLVLQTMQIHRHEPWFFKAYELFKRKEIGELLLLQGQKSYKMGEKPIWMQDKNRFGGIIPWVGTHAIDWAVWFAEKELEVVSANMTKAGNGNQGDVESMAQINLKSGETNINLSLDYLRPESALSHGDDRLRLVGSNGIIEVMNDKVVLINEEGEKEIETVSQINIFDDFINSIENKKEGRVSLIDIKAVQKVCWEAEAFAVKN